MSARRYPEVERRRRNATCAVLAVCAMVLFLAASSYVGFASADVARGLPPSLKLRRTSQPPRSPVQFTDITQATGIDFKHENSATPNKYLIETMGGGVAMLDMD